MAIFDHNPFIEPRPSKYRHVDDQNVDVKDVKQAFDAFLESLWTNVVKVNRTITIHTTVEAIKAITGFPNTIQYNSPYGTVYFEVTDFEDQIA